MMDAQENTPQSTLRSLGAQIEQMEAMRDEHFRHISALEESLRGIKVEYNRITNSLAPISSLPNELLASIFEAGYDPPLLLQQRSGSCYEIVVSQVTQHWRSVALGTPRLWSRIYLDFSNVHYLDMVMLYLERSKALPLDLLIIVVVEVDEEDYIPVRSLISSHVGRMRRFQIVSNTREGVYHLINDLPPSAPLLQSMDIRLDTLAHFDHEYHTSPERIFSCGAPFLTSIRLFGVTLQCCFPPVTALTSLQMHEPVAWVTESNARIMFTGLTGLTHLVINGEFGIDWAAIGSVELPSLRFLRICSDHQVDLIPGLLKAISAPLLQSLLLETLIAQEVDEFATVLNTSAAPKFPLLHSLTMRLVVGHNSPLLDNHWRLLMGYFPTITKFTLWYDNMDVFLETINDNSHSSNSSPPWPELQTLSLLNQPGIGEISVDLLDTTVLARIASGCPIQRIGLSEAVMSSIPADKLESLRAQVEVVECVMYSDVEEDNNFVGW
jgi:hypothetical protein